MEETNNSATGAEIGAVVQIGHASTVNVHASTASQRIAAGRPIAACSALDLEVHSAGDGPLPPYIRRPHDAVLERAVLAATKGGSVMVVLVGGSSTGKTRACWEAVRQLPPRWRLWHPISPGRPQSALADLGAISPHTVVWLNETHHYLLTPGSELGEQVAAGLRELLRSTSPVLILGTLWPEYWQTLTREPQAAEPDPHAQARVLLVGTGTRVADEFTTADIVAAAETGDARLVEATLCARDRQVAQYLAGAPALLERFRTAPAAEAAVITAAMDVRRLGHGLTMSAKLLKDAAPGYLTDSQWNRLDDNWFAEALAACVRPGKGGTSPLTRIRPRPGRTVIEGYQLEDYLEHRSRLTRSAVPVPASTWSSLLTHAASEDHLVLATAARVRGLYRIAYLFYIKAGATRYVHDLLTATQQRTHTSPRAGSEANNEMWQWEAANVHAIRTRTEQLLAKGRTDEALRALEERAAEGSKAAQRMAELLRGKLGLRPPPTSVQAHVERESACDPAAAHRVAAELGEWPAVRRFGSQLLADSGRDGLISWLRNLAIRYSLSPEELMQVLRGSDPPIRTTIVAQRHARDCDPATVLSLLAQLRENDNADLFVDAFERLRACPWALQEAGRLAEALEWHLLVTETGHGNRISAAVHLLRQLDRPDEAEHLVRYGIEPGGRIARPWPA